MFTEEAAEGGEGPPSTAMTPASAPADAEAARRRELAAMRDDDERRDAAWTEHLRRHPLQRNAFKEHSKTLARLVKDGVGPTYRPLIWLQLAKAHAVKDESAMSYQDCLDQTVALQTLITVSPEEDGVRSSHPGADPMETSARRLRRSIREIHNDVMRTYPYNDHLASADLPMVGKLTRVLSAYSFRNPNVGYCQGMNYLVATFLLIGMQEEMAFWMLAAVVERILPQTYYSQSLVGAQADQKVLAILISRKLPRLYAQIERFHTPMSLVTMAWSMTAFLSVLPFQLALRVWDRLLLDGTRVLFQTALAVLKTCERQLTAITDNNQFYMALLHAPTQAAMLPAKFLEAPGVFRLPRLQLAADKSLAVPSAVVDQLRVVCQTTTATELAEWQLGHVSVVPAEAATGSDDRLSGSDVSALSLGSKLSLESADSGQPAAPSPLAVASLSTARVT